MFFPVQSKIQAANDPADSICT